MKMNVVNLLNSTYKFNIINKVANIFMLIKVGLIYMQGFKYTPGNAAE